MDKNEDYNFENLSGTSNLDEVSKVTLSSNFVVNFCVFICNLKAWGPVKVIDVMFSDWLSSSLEFLNQS